MHVAVFGGSFNPVHKAHQQIVKLVADDSNIDLVLVIPTFQHPFNKELIDFNHRYEMCKLAIKSNKAVVSDMESGLETPSYTINTIKHLAYDMFPGAKISLVVGADAYQELPQWYNYNLLKELVSFYSLGRAGFSDTEKAIPLMSSTQIREMIKEKEIDKKLLDFLEPEVLEYIKRNNLY